MKEEHDVLYTKSNSNEYLQKRLIANTFAVTVKITKVDSVLESQQEERGDVMHNRKKFLMFSHLQLTYIA